MLNATLCLNSDTLPVVALVDSGAEEDFIDKRLAEQFGIKLEALEWPLDAWALDGRSLAHVTLVTEPLTLVVSGNHREVHRFHVLSSPSLSLVLGYPWLQTHNPVFDWVRRKVSGWSPTCHAQCLQSALSPGGRVDPTSSPASDVPNLAAVPVEYHDLQEVCSKSRALSLPPHWPYDCAIDLLPGAPLPSSRLYNLSRPEGETMEEYIRNSLAAGIICPSSSPVGAGFFFVAKKQDITSLH
ncbi:hypothetical protein NQD34_009806 [Periophthalmus magnuspinnatus]|nr:hypothetical protein NQD34_009806 [Periophthalmus magnuspinnatus]